MTPPEAPVQTTGRTPPAVSVCLEGLKTRADFLAAARARRQGTAGMLVQGRNRGDDDPRVRVGFTCSKKVGNAVTRNRAKRRLRALAREVLPGMARPGWDYVLIGKPGATVERDFTALRADLVFALTKLHGNS
ncbi:MAG: ribonuclease P protein component [Rhodobacteraceae bacterium]|jgi:ribonuclease P protein component|nr:ribonuclease P protein component [Paracoccaceae bacterium]